METKKIKVIVADDNEALVNEMCAAIEKNKNVEEIFVAKNGEEEFEKILKENPDLIFSDMQMPKMSGLEVIEKIRKRKLQKEPQFVLVTADRNSNLVLKSRELKFDIEYKPVNYDKINQYLDEFIYFSIDSFKYKEKDKTTLECNKKMGFFRKIFTLTNEKKRF